MRSTQLGAKGQRPKDERCAVKIQETNNYIVMVVNTNVYYIQKGQMSISLRDFSLSLILLVCTSRVYTIAITTDDLGIIKLGSSIQRDHK